ncbi:hypothetical protein AB0H71_29000 [Nocardia sp. NPDC050697]|uniref:hypothetical protein n=1 Tax=Nocardia sp. NPDC050697 TaxID=3155158 RepID=UPI0033F4ADB5
MDRHIRISYDRGPVFDYRISETAAVQIEGILQDWVPDAVITVDDRVTAGLPLIPCASLWEP